MELKQKKILLIIGGGISSYKALDLISLLKKNQAIIKTILTPNGKKYEFQNGLYKYTCTVINQEPIELVVYKNEQELRRENFLK